MKMRHLLKFLLSSIIFLTTLAAEAQNKTITGRVLDLAKKEPLPGVSVNVKGSTTSTATDSKGNFTISVPQSDAVLVFSFVGFAQQEITVGNQTSISVSMSSSANQLDEVIVIGFGQTKRRDLTGSVVSIKSDVITQTPTHNPLEALQGRAPGLDITRSSGAAGAGVNINIRGFRSIPASRDQIYDRNAPLVIIDGVQGGDISTLNANDIESIEILKDASSAAIYGAQGGNGVIIVTTKRGVAGKIKVNYSGYYGVNTFMYPSPRIGEDYLNLRREAFRNPPSGAPVWNSPADDLKLFPNLPGELAAYQAGQWVNWLDLIGRNGMQTSHSVSLTAGSDKTRVFLSAGTFKEEGFLRNNNYMRHNVRINVDQTISKIFKAGLTSQITYLNQNNRLDPLTSIFTLAPFGEPYDSNGVIKQFPIVSDNRISPLADERNEFVAKDNLSRTSIITGGYIDITPVKGLTFRSNFNATINFSRRGTYNDRTSLVQANNQLSVAAQTTGYTRFIDWNNVLSYTKSFGDHSLTVTGITSYLKSVNDQLTASGSGQILASQLYYGLASTSTAVTRNISSPYIGWDNFAYAGRLNYSYKGRYVLYLSGRYDGASRLSPGHKWDFFPAAGLAWNVSDEKFFENIGFLNNLKLRATYGVAGNFNSIDPYDTQSGLAYTSRMSFGEVPAPAYIFTSRIGNPQVGWEKTATVNLGVDFGILRNRITGAIDVFRAKTTDMLYKRGLPQSSGVSEVVENIASSLNKGIEITVTSNNIQTNNFKWSTTVNFSRTKQQIVDLINGKDIINPTASERESLLIGRPITSYYNFIKEGIWQTSEAAQAAEIRYNSATGNTFKPGDIKLRDISGPAGKPDGIIDATYDRTYIGSTVPNWIGGLQNTFSYKRFDLGVFLLFRYGQMIDAELLGRYNPSGFGNGPSIINYWTPENPTNDFPRPGMNQNIVNYAGYQTLNFIDGSFFKIKNITLGYTLPKKLSNKIMSDNIRLYATGSNVLTFAKSHLIKDYDPERGGSISSPIGRQFVFGVNVGF